MNHPILFVYGTLKRGGALHHELAAQARFIGIAKIQGDLFRIKGESWPGAFPSQYGNVIQGELYKLERSSEALKKLDRIEGCQERLFTRKLVDAWRGNRKVRAWAYFCDLENKKASRIINGNFPIEITARRSD